MNTKTAEEISEIIWLEFGHTLSRSYSKEKFINDSVNRLSAQSAPLATEGLPVKSNIDLKAIEKEVDEALTIENVTEYLKTHPLPSQLEGNTLKQEGEQWVHLHERLKNQEQTINDFQRGIENLFGLKQNTIAFFGDLQRHPSQPLGGYTLRQVGDAYDSGAQAVQNLFESSGKYLLCGCDVSNNKATYLSTLNNVNQTPVK